MLEKIEVVAHGDEVNGMYVIHDSRLIHNPMVIVWTEGRGNEVPWIDEPWIHSGEHHSVVYRAATQEEEVLIDYYLSRR